MHMFKEVPQLGDLPCISISWVGCFSLVFGKNRARALGVNEQRFN